MKKALITGINGQDGSYLCELLLEKGYEVFGIVRACYTEKTPLAHVEQSRHKINLFYSAITDLDSLSQIVRQLRPDEIYNLAGQSHVSESFKDPFVTVQTAGIGALNIMEAARAEKPDAKIYQASSSEMFGTSIDDDGFQRVTTPMNPGSPYACSKLFAHHLGKNYRSSHGMRVSNGILFNHESPRRGPEFVTSKICREAARIKYGLTDRLELGNVDARRDWGHAKDYVRAMWMILQHDEPDDFICATGITHSVRDIVEYVFGRLELDWKSVVEVNASLLRPEDTHAPKGDSTKIREALGWTPEYTFQTMLDEMIDYWLAEVRISI